MMTETFSQRPLIECIKALQNSARPGPWAAIVPAAKQLPAFLVNLRPGATSQLESLLESELTVRLNTLTELDKGAQYRIVNASFDELKASSAKLPDTSAARVAL
eukprot:2341328-Alexandrium_andersonii.AAC.1